MPLAMSMSRSLVSTLTSSAPVPGLAFSWMAVRTRWNISRFMTRWCGLVARPFEQPPVKNRSHPRTNSDEEPESTVKLHGAPQVRSGVTERVDLRLLPREREEQQVGHLERRVVAAQRRAELGIADDREPAALHGPVEGLGDDPRPDALELAVVQLGLAQDVEPARRPRGHGVLLRRGQVVELRAT